jgi:muconolactone D-isomerase
MEFLVEIAVRLPPEMSREERDGLLAREAARGAELKTNGTIVRIWRIPGRTANVGIWAAPSADEIHDAISSLPLFPYLEARVTALAVHPLEIG